MLYRLLLLFFVMLGAQAWGQDKPAAKPRAGVPFGAIRRPVKADSLKPVVKADTVKMTHADSLREQSDLQAQVDYYAKDSTIMTTDEQIVELFGDAKVDYQDIHLKADYIKLNWKTNEVYAIGRKDSTGRMIGEPIFEQGADTYNTSEIRYNFKSRRAAIKAIITKQGEGNVRGKIVKKDSSNNFFLRGAFYTTCDLVHPHFGIQASKIKLVQGKGDNRQVISGPFNLVIAGVQLPLGLPFGFFPFSEKRKSGFILGNYGEEPQNRGFYLRDFGYYWAVNDYMGLRFTGQVYSKGGWGAGTQGNYIKKYKYSGSYSLIFNHNKSGDEVGSNKTISNDFSIQWSHSPQTLGRPYSFSASVNIASSNYTRNNEQNITSTTGLGRYQQNVFGSSVQYSHNFGNYIQTSANFRVNQNVTTKALTAGVSVSAAVTQFQPFRRKKAVTPAWYESFRLGMNLTSSADLTNNVTTQVTTSSSYSNEFRLFADSTQTKGVKTGIIPFNMENLPTILKNSQVKTSFSVPISLPNFKIARNINVTPGVSLQGDVYTKQYEYEYVKPTFKQDSTGAYVQADSGGVMVRVKSAPGVTYSYAFSLGINTRTYGTFYFKKLGRVEAIRHTFAPSLSLSYTPDFSSPSFGFYQRVQINQRGDQRYLSKYVGYSGSIGKSAAASFSLTNQLEMKVRAKSDTAKNAYEKISLLDNFSISGSYNFMADTMKLSNISLSANTVIKKKYNIAFASVFDPYAVLQDPFVATGVRIRDFKISRGQGLAQLQSMTIGFSTAFKGGSKKKDQKPKEKPEGMSNADMKFIQTNPQLYIDWDVPWNVNVAYNFSYTKYGLAKAQSFQTLSFNGDIKLTEKWAMTFTTGWDFVQGAPSLTNIGLTRNLHCWEAAFNWTPIAQNLRGGNYNFELRVRSSLLKDLKLSRRRSFYDMGGY